MKNKKHITCEDCRKKKKCMERSRHYPCTEFKPLNQPEKEKTARQY